MDKDDIKKLMNKIPQFEEMDSEERDLLADYLEYKKEISGSFIIEEGREGNALYYIVSGKVEISVQSLSVSPPPLVQREKGSTIGEMAVLGLSNIRSATVTALSDAEFLLLSKENY